MPPRSARTALLGIGTIAVGLSLASCVPEPNEETRPKSSAPSATTQDEARTPLTRDTATPSYDDGTYEARGWYGGLPSHQDVTLAIEGDIVTDVQITTPAENETSLGYQQRFADALPAAIVGRPIDELDVDRLAGSSGCSDGFMNALAEIKASARVEQ